MLVNKRIENTFLNFFYHFLKTGFGQGFSHDLFYHHDVITKVFIGKHCNNLKRLGILLNTRVIYPKLHKRLFTTDTKILLIVKTTTVSATQG